MGEKHECLVGHKLFDRNLFHSNNELARAQLLELLHNSGPGFFILEVREDPFFWWLNEKTDVVVVGENLFNVGRSQRGPSLPDTLVLASNADKEFVIHDSDIIPSLNFLLLNIHFVHKCKKLLRYPLNQDSPQIFYYYLASHRRKLK